MAAALQLADADLADHVGLVAGDPAGVELQRDRAAGEPRPLRRDALRAPPPRASRAGARLPILMVSAEAPAAARSAQTARERAHSMPFHRHCSLSDRKKSLDVRRAASAPCAGLMHVLQPARRVRVRRRSRAPCRSRSRNSAASWFFTLTDVASARYGPGAQALRQLDARGRSARARLCLAAADVRGRRAVERDEDVVHARRRRRRRPTRRTCSQQRCGCGTVTSSAMSKGSTENAASHDAPAQYR